MSTLLPRQFLLLWTAALFLGFNIPEPSAQQLHLNEIMASNNATIADEDGDFPDWIEIYNSGDDPIHIEGYGLSDDYDNPFRWVFPDTTIAPGEFMLIWASNKNRTYPGTPLHTNYAISSAGEEIILTHPNGTRLDDLPPIKIPTDISIGRRPDGTGEWFYFDEPTPGASNTTEPIQDLLENPTLSHQPGFYTSGFELELIHPQENVTIYYTLDGSTPTENSAVYAGPITIQNRTNEPNNISTIRTNHLTDRYGFQEPAGLIPKGTVMRTLAVKPGYMPAYSKSSYFVYPEGNEFHNLPVISISTDSTNLFGFDDGIYVPGIHYDQGRHHTGNYYQRGIEWEREAGFEFFGESGELKFAQNVGLRIHGGHSRRFSQKSFRVYARNEYGENRIRYPIFPDQEYDSYNRLLLRNSGNDQGTTMFRDAAAHLAVRHLNMDIQAYRPAVIYINGEYWGIKNIRERYDRHYLERVYGIDPDRIDLLTGHRDIKEGDDRHYSSALNFIDDEDLADDNNMEHVRTLIDMDNFLDYYAAQIYYVNTDWPHNNIDYWRLQTAFDEEAPPGHDGRWRWLFYDIDFTFGLHHPPDYNMLNFTTSETVYGMEWPTLIIRNLLENDSFTRDFINRMADHLNTTFLPGRITGIIDSLQTLIEPEMPQFINRWNHPASIGQWYGYVNTMRGFANTRPMHLRENIVNHFGLESQVEVTVDVNDPGMGTIQVNSLHISPKTEGVPENPYPWTGIYFSDIPITLRADSEKAFVLSHWLVDGEQTDQKELVLDPGSFQTATAVFTRIDLSNIDPFVIADGTYLFNEWDENQPPDSYPDHMVFVSMNEPDPDLHADIAGVTYGAYNLKSRTRINGLGEDGFAFINTTNPDGNPGYPGTRLGGAVLVLDTRNISGAEVGFEAGTVEPNSRVYNLRLQYRTDPDEPFRDLAGPDGNPVEYQRNEEAGHSQFIGPVVLPEDAIGRERVELLWRFYHTGEQIDEESGQRAKLNISAIHVTKTPDEPVPVPFDLSRNPYHFEYWPADTTYGAFPQSMAFVYMSETDPGPEALVIGHTSGAYNLDSRTRINGLGDNGFAFINTSNLDGNDGYPGRRLGGALLALDSEGQGSITVQWSAGTILPHSRIYHLRLQYRTGPDEPFRDVPDSWGNPVEYARNELPGHSQQMGSVLLPPDAEDQPNLELLFRYYYTGEREDEESGQRAMLNISSITVHSEPLMGSPTGPPQEFQLFQNYPNPFYPHTTIRYDLPKDQYVRLNLYTITGRHVAALQDEHAQAGRHSVDVDASGLASGVYIYMFVSDEYTGVGKMSVIK